MIKYDAFEIQRRTNFDERFKILSFFIMANGREADTFEEAVDFAYFNHLLSDASIKQILERRKKY